MDNKWKLDISSRFKERDNPRPLGAMLGRILSPLPDISIELLDGHAIIDADKIYLSNAITNRLAIECTMKEFESANNSAKDWTSSGNTINGLNTSGTTPLTISNHSGSLGEFKAPNPSNSLENKENGKFILQTFPALN